MMRTRRKDDVADPAVVPGATEQEDVEDVEEPVDSSKQIEIQPEVLETDEAKLRQMLASMQVTLRFFRSSKDGGE